MSAPAAILVTTSLDSEAGAEALARTVVTEHLAACVHVAPVSSVYRWRGAVETGREWTCVMTTTPERLEALTARVRMLHSYEVPEILVVPVLAGHAPYLQWLADSVHEG